MVAGPDYPASLTKNLLEMFADAEMQILALIAKRVAVGIDVPDWQMRQLNEQHRLRFELSRLIDALKTGSQAEISRAIDAAYSFGVARAGSELAAAGAAGAVDAIAFGGINLDAMTRLVDTAKAALGSSLLPIQSSAARIYADVVQQTGARMLTGVGTRRQAAALALKDWAKRGVTGFTDRAGRNWSLPTYAEMVARTSASQALQAGHIDRAVETGHDLLLVSDAPEECKLCRVWEGRIVSATGQTAPGSYQAKGTTYTVAGTVEQAKADGLFHPQCRHRTVVYLPGFTRRLRDTADLEGDKLRQSQRYRERMVRRYKREVAVLEPLGGPEWDAAKVKLRNYRAEFKDWREANGRKDLRYRTSLKAR